MRATTWMLLGTLGSLGSLGTLGCADADLISLDVDGAARSYYLHTPAGLDDGAPLVLVFHGGGSHSTTAGRGMARFTGMNALADREGFAVAYPNSVAGNWNDGREGTGALDVDDVAYVRVLLDDVRERVSFDSSRVYASGISNGGFFSQRLACELSGRVAATYSLVGTLAASLAGDCAPDRPVAVAIAAGTADPLVPFDGGQVAGDRGLALGAEDAVDRWVTHDGCSETTTTPLDDVDPNDGSTIEVTVHAGCAGGVAVRFLRIDGGGHTWPGASQYAPKAFVGPVNRDLDASEDLWSFVSSFALP